MKKMQKNKKGGFIVTAELILISTILVLGLLVGMVEVRNALIAELDDISKAFGNICQSYSYTGVANCNTTAVTCGSAFDDVTDGCDTGEINFYVAPVGETNSGVPSA